MKHSIFDKIFLGFLVAFLCAFILVVIYSTNASKEALVKEKTEVITNQAYLITEQSVAGYLQGALSEQDLQNNLNYYSSTLDVSIWILDSKGVVAAYSVAEGHPEPPKNIFFIDQNFELTEAYSYTGTFYDTFTDEVISVAVPIQYIDEPSGMVIIHSTLSQINEVQSNIIRVIYIPFLVMLIISFALLALISQKIMRPIRRINTVAESYSTGNFEVSMDIKSKDEIGQLASTLEYMASELSKLDEYRKDFISNISHDFRSPLTSIKGYAEAIQDGTIPPDKQGKYLNIIVDETKRLSKLTNSLLELNKFDSYGIWLVIKDFDIIKPVKAAMRFYEGTCQEKGINLILNNHCLNTMVKGDQTKIQQVIYNLLDNAIKFTPSGKSIYLTLTELNEKILVSVKDEGCGIPSESLKKIWTRFYKADTSRGKDKQGTGLGLSITREIILAHNENINVVSTEDVGSEFTFSLAKSNEEATEEES
ncbi:MAG: HAMP domain-containing histidine kinase [Lachnospiraceae bacterium]|nr:HAMP domain-containing histidine kinase [Lachnospiraceae bacterium]